MASIASYTELQTDITAILNTDVQEVLDLVPFAIARTEERLNRVLAVQQMGGRYFMNTSEEYNCFPPDVLEIRRVHSVYNGETYSLQNLTPELAVDHVTVDAGTPFGYTIVGESFQIVPPPSETIRLEVLYYKRIVPLSLAAPTNWILEDYSDIYIAGSLAELYIINHEPGLAALQEGRFQTAVKELTSRNKKKMYGGNTLAVRTV